MGRICDNNRPTDIYVLTNPITNEIRYVGKTVIGVDKRLGLHKSDARRNRTTHKDYWVYSLLKQGISPDINILETVPWAESQDREVYWIAVLRAVGCRLTNLTAGGEGNNGRKADESTIQKMKDTWSKKAKPTYQYSLDGAFIKKWNSAKEASEELNILYANIVQCCVKAKKSAGGFMWRYSYNKNIAPWKRNKEKRRSFTNNVMYKLRKRILVIDVNSNKKRIFSSIQHASRSTGISAAGICCECKGTRKTRGNYKFEYYGKNT